MKWAHTRPLACEWEDPRRCASTRKVALMVIADHPAGIYCEKHRKEMQRAWISSLQP